MSKLWKQVELTTENEQNIKIQPTPSMDGVEISYKELSDKGYPGTLYLSRESLEAIYKECVGMFIYLKQ